MGGLNYMCGIFGIAFLQGHKVYNFKIIRVLLRKLLEESKVRGSDATGVAFVTDSDISVIKHNIDASKFIKSNFYKEAEKLHVNEDFKKLRIIIGHTRARTKGTPLDRNNNHPVVTNRIVGIHNGNIVNDDNLFEEYTTAFPETFRRRGRVDTEIIFRLVDHYRHFVGMPMYEAISAANRVIKGSYACALVDVASPWMLYLFRDWSPTDVLYYSKYGLVIFASSRVFIQNAVRGFDLGGSVTLEYDKESCLFINTVSNKISTFNFKEGKTTHNKESDK